MAFRNSHGFLPRTDGALLEWTRSFAAHISSTPTTYGLTQAQADAYDELLGEFVTAYQRATDPNTRTKPSILDKNAVREALKAESRQLARIVASTPGISDAQKATLGLTVRKKPSPIPAPATRPCVKIVSVMARRVTVGLYDSVSSNKRGKPAGATAALIYSFVGIDYPSEPSLWTFQGSTTKAKYEIDFPHTVPGGTQVWMCAAWINAKQEVGPKSTPITTNLQGGGTVVPGNLQLAA